MLDAKKIDYLLEKLNEALKNKSLKGEIGIVGGAAISLLFRDRVATKDVDAIFAPSKEIRKIVSEIAEEENLPKDWLNDAVKAFLSENLEKENYLQLSHLTVWIPPKAYLLAMKAMSARWDSADRADFLRLLKALNLKTTEEVFSLIESYYPKEQIPPKTKFFVEEILE